MKDLEIRGAGNLLGKEQSGRINEVGYENVTGEAVYNVLTNDFQYDALGQIISITRFRDLSAVSLVGPAWIVVRYYFSASALAGTTSQKAGRSTSG